MACSKTVILTRTNGLWDSQRLIHGKNILFVSPGNVEEWINTINKLFDKNDMNRRIASEARQYVLDRGDIRRFAARLEKRCQITLRNFSN
jgi:hypothetical protein